MSNYNYQRPPPPGGAGGAPPPPMMQHGGYQNPGGGAMPPPPGSGGGGYQQSWGQQPPPQQQFRGGPPPPGGGMPGPPPPPGGGGGMPGPPQQAQQRPGGGMGGPLPPGGGGMPGGPMPPPPRGMLSSGPPPPARGTMPPPPGGAGGMPPPPQQGRMPIPPPAAGGMGPPKPPGAGMTMTGPPGVNGPPPPGPPQPPRGMGAPPPQGTGAFGSGGPPPPQQPGPPPPQQPQMGGGGPPPPGGPGAGFQQHQHGGGVGIHPPSQPFSNAQGFAPQQQQPPPPQPQMFQQGHMPPPMARGVNPPTMMGGQPPQQAGPSPGGGGGAPAPPGLATSASTFLEETVDWSIQHPKEMLQFTTKEIPHSLQQSQASKVMLGGVIRPFVDLDIPTVMPGPAGIVRCKKCRTYMNAYVSWMESGRRWRCNICGQPNDCPTAYYSHLDPHTNCRRDKMERPELSQSVVEYIAPNEYMVRPPQPPAYFFVFDVSAQAVGCGMLTHVANALKQVLLEERSLPGSERSQIGFLAYDTAVHYFNLSLRGSTRSSDDNGEGGCQPQMLSVSDLVELFVPLPPDDLLVNLNDHIDTVETFLEALPTMFTLSDDKPSSVRQRESALGPALKAAFTILKPMGGKMLVFNSMLPSIPKIDGYLNPRDAPPGVLGTEQETALLRPQSTWYKDTAVEFSRAQISVDLFLTNFNYVDVATLTDLPRYTAGNVYSFTNFTSAKDGPRMESCLKHTLTRPTALEAVMRVRCTRGLRVTNFYGNFYIRGQDLLALPNCSSDASFGFTIQHEENVVPSNVLTVQSALLYTSTEGERRIRVVTTVLPVTKDPKSVTNSICVETLSALMAKQGADYALKQGPGSARGKLLQGCIDVLKAARAKNAPARLPGAPPGAYGEENSDGGSDEGIPSHLKLLPLMVLAALKNTALRGGTDVHPDERGIAIQTLSTLSIGGSKFQAFLYPKLFRVDRLMDGDAGLPCQEESRRESKEENGGHVPNAVVAGLPGNQIRLPPMMNLTVNSLTSEGIFCLENGVDAYLWIGRQAPPNMIQDLFGGGVESIDEMDPSQLSISYQNSEVGRRLYSILSALQQEGDGNEDGSPRVFIVREAIDQYMEGKFLWHLVEDSAQFDQGGTFDYNQFMQFVQDRSNPHARGVGPGGPPGHGPPGAAGYGPPGAGRMPNGGGPPMPPGPGGPRMGMGGGPMPPPGAPMQQTRGGGPPPPPMQHQQQQNAQQTSLPPGGGPPPPQNNYSYGGPGMPSPQPPQKVNGAGPPPPPGPPGGRSFGGGPPSAPPPQGNRGPPPPRPNAPGGPPPPPPPGGYQPGQQMGRGGGGFSPPPMPPPPR